MRVNLDNPIVPFPASSLETLERKQNKIINAVAKLNLQRMKRKKEKINLFYISIDSIYYK